jgi:hypothetical protein
VTSVIKVCDTLRSSLTKISLMTINDMFVSLKRCIEPYLPQLIKILLKKGSDTNSFISDEAEKALVNMCNYCQDTKILAILMTFSQQNKTTNITRQKLCKCFETLIKQLGNNILFFKDSDKLIGSLANFMSDACQEVRNIAKQAFIQLSKSIMGQNDLEKLLQRVLNEVQYKKVRDFLDKEPLYLAH